MCKPTTSGTAASSHRSGKVDPNDTTASSSSSSPSPSPSSHHLNTTMTTNNGKNSSGQRNRRHLQVLLSLDSFQADSRGCPPSRISIGITVMAMVAFLFASEHVWRQLLAHPSLVPHLPPCLLIQQHQRIVARHVGVDALACALCSLLGYTSSLWQQKKGQLTTTTSTKASGSSSTMEQRLLTYHPEAVRTATVFLAYQVKNLHDSYVWDDGIEFLAHHVFSIVTAWGSMFPGCGHYYTVFFFGVSEISTAVLCLLANFDDQHGVPGLDLAYPTVKVGLGAAFVTLFIVCRCVLWPMYSYQFGKDVLHALQLKDDPRAQTRKAWMYFFLVSLAGLSVLQVAWLGQIFIIARDELVKMGWIV